MADLNSNSQPQDSDLPYWAVFSYCRNFGSVRLRKIYTHFTSLAQAWSAPIAEYKALGFDGEILDELNKKRLALDPHKVWEAIQKEGLTLVPFTSDHYPSLLKEIYDPPALLYFRGVPSSGAHEIRLAVVGTRKMTSYGEQAVEMIVRPLAARGVVIVSGLAFGIDAKAHETTLAAQGTTIAVLGCGLDRATIYPHQHASLADRIVDAGGCIISEFAPLTPPLKHHFPFRNRIIAGMSRATLVIEAPQGSGAITTARYALEFNRDVLAVPGQITSPNAFGPHGLIKNGAAIITCPEDIYEALSLGQVALALDTNAALPNTKEEFKILEFLTPDEPMHIDELSKCAALPPPAVTGALTTLEMKGLVKNVGGMRYIRLN